MKKQLLVIGGSGHAKDIIETARMVGYNDFQIVTTDGSCDIEGLRAIAEKDFRPEAFADCDCAVGIGNNAHRKRFFIDYPQLRFVSIVAPSAVVSQTAELGPGVYVAAHTYIGPDATIGQGAIINTHAIVGHDSIVGDYSQIGPQVCVAGNVTIGRSVFIGAGAIINNGTPSNPLAIPDDVQIGMGCHVTASIKHAGIRLIPKPNHIALAPEEPS